MFVERPELTAELHELARAACIELLRAYGVELTLSPDEWTESDEITLSGVMGFVGPKVRGTCLFAASREVLTAAAPPSAKLRDWVGELANQLVGRIKSKLIARGATISLSTPVVLSGVRWSPLPRTSGRPVLFSADAGILLVWLEAEIDSDFEFQPVTELLANEGEFLVF